VLRKKTKEGVREEIEETLEFEKKRPTFNRPSISIKPGGAPGPITGVVPGNAAVAIPKGMIQEAILEELFAGGGQSMVFKDDKGRFIRANGTYILDWQRPT
jgi:hypothetical protein